MIWVQHSSDDELPVGSDAWQYVEALHREEAEPLVHKRYGDSFEATDLESQLAERGVGRLVVTGRRRLMHASVRRFTAPSPAGTTRSSWETPTPPRISPSGHADARTR